MSEIVPIWSSCRVATLKTACSLSTERIAPRTAAVICSGWSAVFTTMVLNDVGNCSDLEFLQGRNIENRLLAVDGKDRAAHRRGDLFRLVRSLHDNGIERCRKLFRSGVLAGSQH